MGVAFAFNSDGSAECIQHRVGVRCRIRVEGRVRVGGRPGLGVVTSHVNTSIIIIIMNHIIFYYYYYSAVRKRFTGVKQRPLDSYWCARKTRTGSP